MKKFLIILLFFGGLWTIQYPLNASAADSVKDIMGENVITGKAYKMKVTFSDSSAINYLYESNNFFDTWISGSTLEKEANSYRINDLRETEYSTPIFVNQQVGINSGSKWWNVTLPGFIYPNGGIDLRSEGAMFSFHPTSTPYHYSIKYNNDTGTMGWSTTVMSFVTNTKKTGYHIPQISFIPYF